MTDNAEAKHRAQKERIYVLAFALGAALISVLPNLYGLLASPSGSTYQGFQWAADDHFVYAAWMRQAMEGQFMMDNRFAVDAQPGLTIHVLFFALGLLAKITGIPLAMALGKMAFSGLFVILAHRLIQRLTRDTYTTKLALAVTVVGGGVGFLVWENFGPELERSSPFASILAALKVPGAPNDVWQPEAFVFPSILTNALFMASLCLMMGVFLSFLDAKRSWKPVLPGFICMALLMNIHSYDVLLVAMVMIGFLVMQVARRDADLKWIGRAIVIGLGAVPPALWFMHVLQSDAVFQERAATPTYSPNFKVMMLGYVLMAILAAFSVARPEVRTDRRRLAGLGLSLIIVLGMWIGSPSEPINGYFMSLPVWIGMFAVTCVACALLATASPTANLVIAWALIGLVAPYFPALFERKLTMGLSIPWAILAAVGIAAVTLPRDRSKRNMITVLTIVILSGSSMRWLFREVELAKLNVSNTTVHSVYLSRDMRAIVDYLNENEAASNRKIIIALPGIAQKDQDTADLFREPFMPDMNPVLSGLAGVYSYAGHWSETPDYITRRNESTEIFLERTTSERRSEILSRVQPHYIVAPAPEAFSEIADLSSLGEVVAGGNQFKLVKLR